MTVARMPFRRALATATIGVLAVSGALVATSAAQAVPEAPIIFGPLDSLTNVLTVEVDPAPSTLEQTVSVSWAHDGTGTVGVGCQVVIPADTPDGTTFPCDTTVPPGQFGFYNLTAISTDADGDSPVSDVMGAVRYGEPADPGSLVPGAPLDGPESPVDVDGLETAITGLGPALSTIDVRASLPEQAAIDICVTTASSTGAFTCPTVFPDYGLWNVRFFVTDVEGGETVFPADLGSIAVSVNPPVPTVASSTSFSAIGVDLEGVPGSNVGAALVLDAFGSPAEGGFCPAAWEGNPAAPPTGGAAVGCFFPAVTPGIHLLQSTQFINGAVSIARDDLFYAAATPTLVVEPFPGGAVFSGTVDTLTSDLTASGTRIDGLAVIVRDAASNTVCSGDVDLATGAWSCDGPIESGDDSFAAYTEVQGFGDDPDALGAVNGTYSTVSAISSDVAATIPGGVAPPPPTMGYSFGPATVDVTAQGLENSSIGIRLYSVTVTEGEGEGYTYGPALDSCGLIVESEGEGFGEIATAPSSISDCSFGPLTPGIWNIWSSQRYYFQESEYRDHYVRIPAAPSLSAEPAGPTQVIASGNGTPGFRVLVRELGGAGACDAVVGAGGTWSCVISGVSGETLLRAQQQSQGFVATPDIFFGFVESYDGFSAYTATVSVAAPPATAVAPLPAPTPPAPLPWVLEGYDGQPLFPGQALALSAQGLPVGTEIIIEIRSTPQVLGSSLADDLGRFALDVTVPRDIEPGDHTLVGLATPPGGVVSPIEIPVVVVAAPVEDAAGEQPAPAAEGSSGGSGGLDGAVDRTDPAAPSAISDSIPTIDRIFRTPLIAVTASGLALAILLLVALPAELLNSTVASNSRRLGRWYAAIDDRIQRATEWFAGITRTRALAAALLVIATAVIFGFVDPDYGFDPVSLRMTVSLAIGLFVVTYVSAWISGAIIQRVWSIPTRVGLQPAALLFAVVGVIIARLLEFSPGFLIGLVIGLDLLTRVDAKFRVRATLTSLGVTVGLALLGWVGFSILTAVSTGEPSVVELLLSDALVATAAEGMTAALASLLPLGFLQGHEIFRRSKGLWAGTFLVVATLFALIVLPTASETEGEVADVGFWMLVMVIFAAVTLTLWAVLQFTGRRDEELDEAVEEPAGAAR